MRSFISGLVLLFPLAAMALPVGTWYAPVSCQNGKYTVYESPSGNVIAIQNQNPENAPPAELEDCRLSITADGLNCQSNSVFLHASRNGGSYVISAGAKDPFPVNCRFFPATP